MSLKFVFPATVIPALCLLGIAVGSGASAPGEKPEPSVAAAEGAAGDSGESESPREGRSKRGKDARVSFRNDVLPLLSSVGCNASQCHGASNGKGGLKLSMFGADPDSDFDALARADAARRVNPVEPRKSLLLLKATGAISHGGQQRIEPNSPQYDVLAGWLTSGARKDDANSPRIVAIAVTPNVVKLAVDQTDQLTAMAAFSHFAKKDVTRDAQFQSLNPAVVVADAGGKLRGVGAGQTYVVVTFNRCSAVARVVVPQPLSSPFPKSEEFNKIDELVLDKLKELGIPPSELSSDQEFLRRVYLDVIGQLPTPKEVLAFLADQDPKKRAKCIDQLLDRDEFADFWALKWGDLLRIKAEYPSNLWPNAVQAYHYWIRDSIAKNKPYDEFARELLVSSGCNFREPPANYYRAMKKRDPQGFAESTALVFMGARLGCASCHAHPTESWTLNDSLGMAAFFSQIKFKDTKEWKEEIVYVDPTQMLRDPKTREPVVPKPLDDKPIQVAANEDPRAKFAQWLTASRNPWFAKNIVNRIWFWLVGQGIVQEPDDLRQTNPPSNPALLAYLEKELVDHQFDTKHIYRLILNSAAYQRSSAGNRWNQQDTMFFSHYTAKRLTAETLSDAIGQVTQAWDGFSSQIPEPYSRWPSGFRAVQLADGSVGTPFLELFGRPPRDTAYESDRDCKASMRQSLYLMTSAEFEAKIASSPRVKKWVKEKTANEAIVDQLFLLALSRQPTAEEKQKAMEHMADDPKTREQSLQDLVWAVLNTKEFLFNH